MPHPPDESDRILSASIRSEPRKHMTRNECLAFDSLGCQTPIVLGAGLMSASVVWEFPSAAQPHSEDGHRPVVGDRAAAIRRRAGA